MPASSPTRTDSPLRKRLAVVGLAVVSVLLTLVAADRLLYFASPWLPASLDHALSPHAQLRRILADPDGQPWVFAENIRYARSGASIDGHPADALGYRNPAGQAVEGMTTDVLLLGDSFTWGTEERTVADYLREDLAPQAIYSAGMGGEGIPEWRYHYRHFLDHAARPPRVVVLNFYSGNDVRDTWHWLAIRDRFGTVSSAVYFAYLASAADREQLGASWLSRNGTLLELRYLLDHALANLAASSNPEDRPAALPATVPASRFYIRHEPNPAAVSQEILDEIKASVLAIRAAEPSTIIVLSYIPSSGALYGKLVGDCPGCIEDARRQPVISAKLAGLARDLGLVYVDPTADLRRDAMQAAILNDTHFNPRGYALYAGYVARAVRAAEAASPAGTSPGLLPRQVDP
jgi:hypothetical protein